MGILSDIEQAQAAAAVEGGLVAEGIYACRITGVERWTSGTSLVWKLRIEQGQDGAGRELYDWTGLSERGIWKTKERYEALGVPLDAGEEEFLGMVVKVSVEVGINDQTGAPKNKVVSVTRGEGEAKPVAEPVTAEDDSDIPF